MNDMNEKSNLPLYEMRRTGDNLQFDIMRMPDAFRQKGNAPFDVHIHKFYQIIYFKNASGSHFVDFKKYPLSGNTLFFISPGQIHYFDREISSDGAIIHFDESFLSDESSGESVFLKYNMFNAFDAEPFCQLTDKDAERLDVIIRKLYEETLNKDLFAHEDYLKYLVKLFLIEARRVGNWKTGTTLRVNDSSDRLFIRFRQMLEANYKRTHTVKEYASALSVSSKTLSNCVSEKARSTPLKLINDRIILEAKRQLFYSDVKVKELAYELGFEDPSYFVKFFKRQSGFLPVEFRERSQLR